LILTSADDLTRDSADIAAVLEDRDLTRTKRFIQAARTGTPANPARALKLLRMIATRRPAEELFTDAAGFIAQDRTYILVVAALERDVEQAAAILLLDGIGQNERQEVAGTFARQRLTSDVAQLISHIRVAGRRSKADKKQADAIVETILSEFTRGVDNPGHGGRPAQDVALLYVQLIGEGSGSEANALLTMVFKKRWQTGLAVELAREFDHFMPGTDVLAEWARRNSSGDIVRVMAELLIRASESSRRQARMTEVGDHWKPKIVVHLCQHLKDGGQVGAVSELRRNTLSRLDLSQVAEAVAAWWGTIGDREALLKEAVHGRQGPRTVDEVGDLARALELELLPGDAEVCDRLRRLAPVDGCSGDDLVKLLSEVAEGRRRDAGAKFAERMALAAEERRVAVQALVHYLTSLRRATWKSSQTAAKSMVDELIDGACEAEVVAPVGALLLGDKTTRKDGETVLRGYLNKESSISADDVATIFSCMQEMGMDGDAFVQGLAQATVGRWRPARRNEAAAALRDAGITEPAGQVLARR
jgi:hypothetical protein